MANYDNDWDRNRRGFNQQWNDDDPYGNQNYSNDYNRRMSAISGTCPMVPQIMITAAGEAITGTWAQEIMTTVTDTTATSTGTVTWAAAALQTTAMVHKVLTTTMDETTIGGEMTATGGTRQRMKYHPGLETTMLNDGRRMDERRGDYRGKGPKGYTRSDERIKEDVNDRLSDDSSLDASDIEVSVQNCEVTLSGTVNTRWEKRRAEDCAESVSGVKNVENRIKVKSPDSNYNAGPYNTGSATGSKASSFSSNS
jgi:osmotically-inducible protein OsmY